jgi:uncharacterized protein YbjT (DUF2867 family)
MRILVTGGTGFIGKPLVHRLLLRGDDVTVLSRRPTSVQAIFGEAAEAGIACRHGLPTARSMPSSILPANRS